MGYKSFIKKFSIYAFLFIPILLFLFNAYFQTSKLLLPDGDSRFCRYINFACGLFLFDLYPLASDLLYPKVIDEINQLKLQKNHFWEKIPADSLLKCDYFFLDFFDDAGIGFFSGILFKLFNGIFPLLIPWLCIFLVVFIFLILVSLFHSSGNSIAATVFITLCSFSGFLVDGFAMIYSGSGYYLASVLILLIFSYNSVKGKINSIREFNLFSFLIGILFGICILCRFCSIAILFGYFTAIYFWIKRNNFPKKILVFCLAFLSLITPYVILRTFINYKIKTSLQKAHLSSTQNFKSQSHPVWHGIWIGLGDYDTEKGFVYNDNCAADYVRKITGKKYESNFITDSIVDDLYETTLKKKVLQEISDDPIWYLKILLKRFAAVVFQTKIMPWGPLQGKSINTNPSELRSDGIKIYSLYYNNCLSNADFFFFRNHKLELPVQVILLPMIILVACYIIFLFKNEERSLSRYSEYFKIFSCMSVGILPLPLFITTFGCVETEAMVFVYFLSFAFFMEEIFVCIKNKKNDLSNGSRH